MPTSAYACATALTPSGVGSGNSANMSYDAVQPLRTISAAPITAERYLSSRVRRPVAHGTPLRYSSSV